MALNRTHIVHVTPPKLTKSKFENWKKRSWLDPSSSLMFYWLEFPGKYQKCLVSFHNSENNDPGVRHSVCTEIIEGTGLPISTGRSIRKRRSVVIIIIKTELAGRMHSFKDRLPSTSAGLIRQSCTKWLAEQLRFKRFSIVQKWHHVLQRRKRDHQPL